ncbi:GtrA family protein [Rhodococcus antarcticus]|uniref:GtrA family protein n=1 Tax=Rhodococcus antarcticus TaxID=2987751 RepID=A0ABY6NYS6_9NOCA|nr:GtrA family protein [Rhodococcus antarcticus]UZJ24550.1 GtrA family protein [Rhodococcus antarcticus]
MPILPRRFSVYLVVGAASVGTDLGLLLLLREGFGTPVWIAGTVGYGASVTVNYGLNRTLAFRDRVATRTSVLRYTALLGFNWVTTLAVLDLADVVGVGYLLGKVVAVAFLTTGNYLAYARWVFPVTTES